MKVQNLVRHVEARVGLAQRVGLRDAQGFHGSFDFPTGDKGHFRLGVDGAGQPVSLVERYERIEDGYKDETTTFSAAADGVKTYGRNLYFDNGGQIVSHSESLRVGPGGASNYQMISDSSVELPNLIRRNRASQTLVGLAAGGTVGAAVGNLVAGAPGAILGGLLTANLVDLAMSGEQKRNNASVPSGFDQAISGPVKALRVGVQAAGVAAGLVGLAALL